MAVNFSSQKIRGNKFKMFTGIDENISDFTVGIDNGAKNNVGVSNYFHLANLL